MHHFGPLHVRSNEPIPSESVGTKRMTVCSISMAGIKYITNQNMTVFIKKYPYNHALPKSIDMILSGSVEWRDIVGICGMVIIQNIIHSHVSGRGYKIGCVRPVQIFRFTIRPGICIYVTYVRRDLGQPYWQIGHNTGGCVNALVFSLFHVSSFFIQWL